MHNYIRQEDYDEGIKFYIEALNHVKTTEQNCEVYLLLGQAYCENVYIVFYHKIEKL